MVCIPIRPVTVPIWSVTVHLARKGFQHCVVYCFQRWCTLLCCNQGCCQCIVSYSVQPLGSPSVNYLGTLLICHCPQCNQSCHRFVAKHTLMSFITDLGYFVSWGNHNEQTIFSLLDAVISELLTTAPAHVDKHMWPERKVIMCATFVVYVMSIESLDTDLCRSLVCSSGRKP